MSSDSLSLPAPWPRRRARAERRLRLSRLFARPELLLLIGVSGLLNLWGLSINGWANTYYSAAVRSMAASWHNFLFASMDPSGLMTVDKPPLSLWVQALSARVFGFHPLSLLVPQALMGIVAVGLLYDLTRRRFGRVAGFVAGLVLALIPVAVAVSRHNNPDELLVLCSVVALWFALRALESGRTRWLVMAGVAVGLGFETKMGVALFIVPGIAVAWIWTRVLSQPTVRARWRSFAQLLAGGLAMVAVSGAWPLLVTLTPAADRPWISGTSDNSIWSLIFGYNGLGRVAGQSGGPGGAGGPGGGTMFGGATGPLRLLQTGLGDQAGWLLGLALVSGLAVLVLTRLRRSDPRTGWLLAVGGAFACTAVVFSFAGGIFHPYYVSLLAPFAAALIGGGVAEMLPAPLGRARGLRAARVIAPVALIAGASTELVVLGELNGQLSWAVPLVIVVTGAGAVALATALPLRWRAAVLGLALAGLLAAPAIWAAQTLGHATNGTFPTGGPAGAASVGGPPGGGPPGAPGARAGFGGGPFGAGSASLTAALAYAKAHGGGTVAVSSQSSAAAAIVSSHGNVAGIGGFSGRETSVSASWIAGEVRTGHLRWIVAEDTAGPGARLPGDTRSGSQSAIAVAERVCPAVTVKTSGGTSVTMYDCSGRAAAILKAAA